MPKILRDLIPGVLTGVITLTSTLSYVTFIFSGAPSSAFHYAVAFGLVSAGVMAIVYALLSEIPFAIAGPDSKSTAVLAITAALIAGAIGAKTPPNQAGLIVLAVLVSGTLATGAAMYFFGLFRMGQWVRFVPYPVIAGFMGASGWFLAVGGIGVLSGTHISWTSLRVLIAGHHWPQIVCGLGFAAGYAFVARVRNPFAFPIFLAAAIGFVHALLLWWGYSIDAARAAGWLLDVGGGSQIVNPLALADTLRALDLGTIGRLAGEFIALFIVTLMTLLLGLVVLEVEGRLDVDLDRELRLNGLANLLVGMAGGMVGTISVNRTMFNFKTGARGRASGLIVGVICLAMLGFGAHALVYFPVPILGGLLVYQGADLLHEWLVRGRGSMLAVDYVQVIIIIIAIVFWDFVAGVAIGVVVACVTFAVNTSRIRLVKLGTDRSSFPSRVDRPVAHQEELVRSGHSIQILWLHGFVFFGSAHRLLQDVKNIVATCGPGVCRRLILDFREVLGIDSSAILNLGKLWNFAETEGFAIALSSLSPAVEKILRIGGLIREHESVGRVFPDLDTALEWCEDALIAERITDEAALHSLDEWLAREFGSLELVARLLPYLELHEFETGNYIFKQGAKADTLFFLHTGRVTILYTTPEGTELRLRSMVGRTILGEMGIYRTQPRMASVRADRHCVAYALSAEAIARMEADDPSLAYALHKFIVRILASRLEFANREIAGLQS
ncbi:MAG: SulP family inorganic anion transporter [Rhizomicrobium sp.]